MPNFIEIQSQVTTGALSGLPRDIVIATREAVTGFTADLETGLYKIFSTDVPAFETANSGELGLINALRTVFAGSIRPDFVYILSAVGVALTSAMLNKADSRPRDWSFITLCSQYQGGGDTAPGGESAAYFADLGTIGTWLTPAKQKICVHTYSEEQVGNALLTLPAQLLPAGAIRINSQIKTIVSNSKHIISTENCYDNIALAWLAYVFFGPQIARGAGSLSDAHDFAYIASDTYDIASRNFIYSNSLGQYNGSRDRGNSFFVYDTLMNDNDNSPNTDQIESLAAQYYIDDYTYVYVRNSLQAAGQTGLTNDQAGIDQFSALVNKALQDCFDLGLILSKENGSPDYSLQVLSAAQVTQLARTWQANGVWPAGVVTGQIRRYASTHYVTINFVYQ